MRAGDVGMFVANLSLLGEKLPTSVLKLMVQEVQAMEDLGHAAVVVAEAVVEATAEAAVIPQEEAEDLHATLPATADPLNPAHFHLEAPRPGDRSTE